MALSAGNLKPWRLAAIVAIGLSIGLWVVDEAVRLRSVESVDFESIVTAHKVFNVVEGFLWLGVGVVLIWKGRFFKRSSLPASCAGVAFLLFGVSDFIEVRTGSWFQPTWLLVWNVTCVVALVCCLA